MITFSGWFMACFVNIYQTRTYTGEYYRIYAKWFKRLLREPAHNKKAGEFELNYSWLSPEHSKFKLYECEEYPRVMLFEINGKKIPVPLQTDNRSASNKLYLICPYCEQQRQHLFVMKYGFSCRDCAKLHYASQSEGYSDRLARKIRKLRKRIWGNTYHDINNLFEQSYYHFCK